MKLFTVAYIVNRVPNKGVSATLYELWHGKKYLWIAYTNRVRLAMSRTQPTNIENLYVHNSTHKHRKLGFRTTKMVFIRYPKHSKGNVMYEKYPNSGMTEIDSHNVDFLEDELPSIREIKKNLKLYELQ